MQTMYTRSTLYRRSRRKAGGTKTAENVGMLAVSMESANFIYICDETHAYVLHNYTLFWTVVVMVRKCIWRDFYRIGTLFGSPVIEGTRSSDVSSFDEIYALAIGALARPCRAVWHSSHSKIWKAPRRDQLRCMGTSTSQVRRLRWPA